MLPKYLTAIAVAISAAVALSPDTARANCDTGETTIKLSHVVAASGHPKGDAATAFAAAVNSELNGRICVEVYPNSTLYDDDKVLEAMLLGDVQMAAPSLSKMEKYTKRFRIFDLPFLFRDAESVYEFQDSAAGAELARSVEDKGLLMLGYWPNGMKQMSANKPLVSPEDASGLKFRIQSSEVLQAQFEALDASPQKLAFKEVYGALQTGVVDGQENTYSNIYTKKFFEVQDGLTESNHGILTYGVVTSTEFWNSLSAQDRGDLERILARVTSESRASAKASNLSAKENIISSGGTVRTLTAAQRNAWVNAMRPVWDQFSDDIGSDLIESASSFSN
ncbi:MAG: DctP family TRAP transporter solute-binding subunit [Alphaproteobacteria bacterium]|nr:DctP family TRAP transporter solute-binding subunit [Alphaproteobacteria bacterium]